MTEEEARAVIAIILMTKTKLGGWWYDITPFDLLNEFSREFPQFAELVELAEEEEQRRQYEIRQEQIKRLEAKREYQREYRRTRKKEMKE